MIISKEGLKSTKRRGVRDVFESEVPFPDRVGPVSIDTQDLREHEVVERDSTFIRWVSVCMREPRDEMDAFKDMKQASIFLLTLLTACRTSDDT